MVKKFRRHGRRRENEDTQDMHGVSRLYAVHYSMECAQVDAMLSCSSLIMSHITMENALLGLDLAIGLDGDLVVALKG
jgi:hypothetical protein